MLHIKTRTILAATAKVSSVALVDLLSTRRHNKVVRPRQMAMFLARELSSASLPEIGRRIGGRDHTTVLHAVRRVEASITADATAADQVLEICTQALLLSGYHAARTDVHFEGVALRFSPRLTVELFGEPSPLASIERRVKELEQRCEALERERDTLARERDEHEAPPAGRALVVARDLTPAERMRRVRVPVSRIRTPSQVTGSNPASVPPYQLSALCQQREREEVERRYAPTMHDLLDIRRWA